MIASYPITPTKIYKSILFDFNIFEGNSGGPLSHPLIFHMNEKV
jgi:hypothetical protein